MPVVSRGKTLARQKANHFTWIAPYCTLFLRRFLCFREDLGYYGTLAKLGLWWVDISQTLALHDWFQTYWAPKVSWITPTITTRCRFVASPYFEYLRIVNQDFRYLGGNTWNGGARAHIANRFSGRRTCYAMFRFKPHIPTMLGPQSIVKLFELTWNNSNNDRVYDTSIVFMRLFVNQQTSCPEAALLSRPDLRGIAQRGDPCRKVTHGSIPPWRIQRFDGLDHPWRWQNDDGASCCFTSITQSIGWFIHEHAEHAYDQPTEWQRVLNAAELCAGLTGMARYAS